MLARFPSSPPSPSNLSSALDYKIQQYLKITEEEKLESVPGSVTATLVALGLRSPQ